MPHVTVYFHGLTTMSTLFWGVGPVYEEMCLFPLSALLPLLLLLLFCCEGWIQPQRTPASGSSQMFSLSHRWISLFSETAVSVFTLGAGDSLLFDWLISYVQGFDNIKDNLKSSWQKNVALIDSWTVVSRRYRRCSEVVWAGVQIFFFTWC